MKFSIFLLSAFYFFNGTAQSSWPAESWNSAVNLTDIMDSDGITDLSGLHFNPTNNRLYCAQGDGRLRVLQLNSTTNTFSQIANKSVPDGPEGITQVDFSSNTFYTIDENNYEVRKYNHTASFSTVTLSRTWNLLASPSPMEDTGNIGPEGIAFVPDSFINSSGFISSVTGLAYTSVKGMGGLMFIAHQEVGYVWVYDINPNVSDDFAFVGKYRTARTESCDLAFDRSTGILYILHNVPGENTIEATDLVTSMVNGERTFNTISEYNVTVPSDNDNIEGFAIAPKCPGSGVVSAWLCRDVESNEDDQVQQDALRWFDDFNSNGNCSPLGVQFPDSGEFSIYPNPADENIFISFDGDVDPNLQIGIYNTLGQSVMKILPTDNFSTVDISKLTPGVYFVRYSDGGRRYQARLIKK